MDHCCNFCASSVSKIIKFCKHDVCQNCFNKHCSKGICAFCNSDESVIFTILSDSIDSKNIQTNFPEFKQRLLEVHPLRFYTINSMENGIFEHVTEKIISDLKKYDQFLPITLYVMGSDFHSIMKGDIISKIQVFCGKIDHDINLDQYVTWLKDVTSDLPRL